MKKIYTVMAMSLIALSISAVAAVPSTERQAKMQARFQALDTNRDGKLSYDEMQNNAERRERFEKADLNRDGGLSQDEMKQAYEAKKSMRGERKGEHAEKLRRLDANQDKALTRAEIGNEMPKLLENFDIFDGNNDGKITQEEMQVAKKAMRAERGGRAK